MKLIRNYLIDKRCDEIVFKGLYALETNDPSCYYYVKCIERMQKLKH